MDPINSLPQILLVDDDNTARKLTAAMLADSDYQVATAKDGAAGWEALQTRSFDLVITDNRMPKMNGIEMIEMMHFASIKVPVVMATGGLPVNALVRKPWLCPDATLTRPFSGVDLLDTVKMVLNRYQNRSQRRHISEKRYGVDFYDPAIIYDYQEDSNR